MINSMSRESLVTSLLLLTLSKEIKAKFDISKSNQAKIQEETDIITEHCVEGRGRATKQDGRLERELRAEAVPEGRRGREDSRTTHRVRCSSTPTTAATRNHVRGPRGCGTQGRKLATRPRPIRPGKRGGVASSEERGRRARSGKEQAEQAAGTAGAVTTRIHLPTTPTNTRGPSPPHRETGRHSKGVRPLRQPGEKPKER
ncbi:hypothetical protein NDU88_008866 [Pleurodeles waltl]|uniref:Uncharacterized protein n=1 Tax=Pleurodeles waltl TaxID=8319 RepID=A0AAV7PR23_PLEWA|nr:hypothetical protein NDU88_008866 [Pleurodeles waltl]